MANIPLSPKKTKGNGWETSVLIHICILSHFTSILEVDQSVDNVAVERYGHLEKKLVPIHGYWESFDKINFSL